MKSSILEIELEAIFEERKIRRRMRISWKGRREKGLQRHFCFRLAGQFDRSTTRLRQTRGLTAIRNPHETFRNDSVTRLRSGSPFFFLLFFFFFFYSTPVHVAPWPPLFRLHKFHVETPGTQETWNFDWENDPHESSTIPINFPFRTFDNWRGIERGHRDKTWKSQRFERGELPIRERIGLNQQAYGRMLIFEIIEILSFYERIVHAFESIIDVIHSKWTVARRVDVKFSHGWSNAWLVKLRHLSLISRSIRFESTSRMDAA